MEGGKANVTAFQLAAELAFHAPTSASASPPSASAAAANDGPSNTRTGNKKADCTVDTAKHRGTRSQVQHLLDEQRRFALRDGTPYDDAGKLRTHARSMMAASSLLKQRMPQNMYGQGSSFASAGKGGSPLSVHTTSESAALQDVVLRWGPMKNGPADGASDGDVGAYARHGGHGGPASSSPFLRHTWHLIELERRPTSSPDSAQPTATAEATASTSTNLRSLRQRWERSDDLVEANALLTAVQGEITRRQKHVVGSDSTVDAGNTLYQRGLELCAESVRSSTSLPTCFSAAALSLSPALSFFSFTEEEYNALTQPPPPPLPPSTFTFTYAGSCYLFELWSRFGNPVVVVDRWAWDTARAQPLQPDTTPLHKLSFSPSSREMSPPTTQVASQQAMQDANDSTGKAGRCVPSVEQLCAEYHRVTSGVLQQRQRRLLQAVLMQQEQRQLHNSRAHASITASATSSTNNVSVNSNTPFIASFDRYALLHAAKNDDVRSDRKSRTAIASPAPQPPQLPLPYQPSPPPADPHTAAPSTPAANAVHADGSADRLSSASPLPAPRDRSAGLTPQQRLTTYTTPHPWYQYPAELQRRAAVAELLRGEGAANVPYQKAAATYLAIAASAAQALQRASLVFDDRDRVEVNEEGRWEHEATKLSATREKANEAVLISGTPPRGAFTVQLQPLPNVDSAAWKAAEAALHKAAIEVLGISAPRLSSTAHPRHHPARRGKRSRSNASISGGGRGGAARSAPKRVQRKDRESGGAAATAASSSAVNKQHKEKPLATSAHDEEVDDSDDEGADSALRHGSSESSITSNNKSDNSDEDEEADEDESTSSGDRDQDDENADGDDDAVHLFQEQDELGEGIAEENGRNADIASQPRQRSGGRRVRGPPRRSCAPLSTLQPAHLHSDASYRALQEYIASVLPFRCTRLRVAAQAGWLLPTPPALPHSLTDPLDEKEVVLVDTHAALRRQPYKRREPSRSGAVVDLDERGAEGTHDISPHKAATASSSPSTASTVNAEPASGANKAQDDLYQPILTEEDYQALRKVSASAVCNRVVSHTGEAVLLSLPPALPRVHREVEQELERYLYDDTSAMMEVNAAAQSLMAEIRVAYTQNIYLQRYMARLEHVVENLKKVEQDCRAAQKAVGGAGAGDPRTSM